MPSGSCSFRITDSGLCEGIYIDFNLQWKYNKDGLPINDVKLDSFISKVLRPHQQQGVLFLYSCVTGMRNVKHCGAILADEMGLGKTLQCICLIWYEFLFE